MLALFTDFGASGPYMGQMRMVLHRGAPGCPVVDLCADAPMFDPQASAYLLAALVPAVPPGTVVVGVVDPGVGSSRDTVMMEADGRWFVGPDNGLFALVARRAARRRAFRVFPPAGPVSASFHGRDVFAPAAARLARGDQPNSASGVDAATIDRAAWPDDLPRIVYVDHYGNAMTGLRAASLTADAHLAVRGWTAPPARTFSDVPERACLWYENSQGLAEVAVNQGRADQTLGVRIGDAVAVVCPGSGAGRAGDTQARGRQWQKPERSRILSGTDPGQPEDTSWQRTGNGHGMLAEVLGRARQYSVSFA